MSGLPATPDASWDSGVRPLAPLLPGIDVADALPPANPAAHELAALLDAPPETAQRALRAAGPRSFLGAIRALHDQHETARRARSSLARRRIAVSGRMTRPGSELGLMIGDCGSVQVGLTDTWDMLVVGADPSRRALARAARDGMAVIGESDLAAMVGLIRRFSEKQESTSAVAIERARQEARQLEASRRAPLQQSTRQMDEMAARLVDVAKQRRQRSGGMHTGRRNAA
jgi:hypothetical protein